MNKRLFILGLDGATFDIIDPLVKEGRLPSFRKLAQEGSWGKLRSSIPPQSSVAWPVALTGVNPGRTGIFAFWQQLKGRWERPLINSSVLRAPTLFDHLAEQGGSGVSFNVPVSFPPRDNPAIIVTGLLSPSIEAGITKPASLLVELIARGLRPPVEMELLGMTGQPPGVPVLERLYENLSRREEIMHYLMSTKPWDCFMAVFTISDRIQHFFWHAMDRSHPGYSQASADSYGEAIRHCYIRLDRLIGRLLEKLEDTSLIVMSDHGFGPKTKNFFLNKWLEQCNYLKLKRPFQRYGLSRHGRSLRLARKKLEEIIDWRRTTAYSNWIGSQEGIYINLRGREPEGIVDPADYDGLVEQIKTDLESLRNPDNGEKLVDIVYTRDEIYEGPYTDSAPDLVMIMQDHSFMPSPNLQAQQLFSSTSDPAFSGRQEGESGQHRDHGILYVHGDGIAKDNQVDGAGLEDILPLAFYLMRRPIPAKLDGFLREEIIEPWFRKKFPPDYMKTETAKCVESGSSEMILNDEDDKEIKKRLKGLGYIE